MNTTLLNRKNFTIDSSSWKTEETIGLINGKQRPITIKVNSEGDVREYIRGVPAAFVGQQLFTYGAAIRETRNVGKSLPEDQYIFQQVIATMLGTTEDQKYKNYLKETNVQFVGCYSSGLHVFDDIGTWAYYRLADGTRLHINSTTWGLARRDEMMGYSVRVA